ncbi:MAG: MarR family transcriptional regulator [Litorimonas sp.]
MSAMKTAFVPRLVSVTVPAETALPVVRKTQTDKVSRKDSLAFWHRVTLATVRSDAPDLSARQLAMLMTIYLEDGLHTVRSLAKHLDVTKAAISRATDSLCKLGYIERKPDHRDKRSVVLARTSSGIHFLSEFADIIQAERI